MGMPITVEIVDAANVDTINIVFDYLNQVDARFSTYKNESEISAFNRGEVLPANLSAEMKEVLRWAAITRDQSKGFFEIRKPAEYRESDRRHRDHRDRGDAGDHHGRD